MKPLQKVIIIRKISEELKRHGFSWDEAYYYLKDYDSTVVYHENYIGGNLDSYIVSSLSSMKEEKLSAMYNELIGEIIPSDTFEQTIMNADCWRSGYYRIFISHLTEDKKSAAYLKNQLAKYGIDCFVAHEDIEPTKLWQTEIEKALASMDLLCAILTPKFYQSKWCDQEVGIALGRSIPTLSIKKGADPHGFIGKYQAIKAKSTAIAVAKDVFETICKMDNANQKYFYILGDLFLNSKNTTEAMEWLKLIGKIPNYSDEAINKISSSNKLTNLLDTKEIVAEYNKLLKKFGRTEIVFFNPTEMAIDLPF